MNPVIRPTNGLLLIALQTAEGSPTTLDPLLHAVSIEDGSFTYANPFRAEDSDESNGSLVAGGPMIIGQEVPISFRAKMRGAGNGITYTALIKPPLHAAFGCCGWRGQFQAAIAAAALTAGSTTTATLGTGYTGTAQLYMGMPLALSVGPGAGHVPLITNYTAGKVATLSDQLATLTTATLAAIPANWTYAGTTPIDAASRLTDTPCATVGWYEDGNLLQWQDVRGIMDLDGESAKPGFATFNMTGTFMGSSTVTMPTNQVVAAHSAPVLTKGTGLPSALLVNRIELPISKWSLKTGGSLQSIVDPNTQYGFGPGQLAGRKPIFGADPLGTLVSTFDAMAEIGTAPNYPITARFGQTAGNRWSLLLPTAQPITANPSMRGENRAFDKEWQGLTAGRDAQNRDSDRFLSFF